MAEMIKLDKKYVSAPPDYDRSIVNLAASLAPALGGEPQGYAPLAELREISFSGRPIVLLVIDGLGDIFLQNHPDSFLYRQRRGRLSSVFPPTTATAVTSLFTGVAPQQHAITGWHTYFRELGTVATVLPFMPRYGGAGFSEAGISSSHFIDHGSLLDTLDVPSHVVLPHHLMNSDYSRTLSGRALRHGYDGLVEMMLCIETLAEEESRSLIIAYWPYLDSLAHSRGIGSMEAAAHFAELDTACRDSLAALAGRGASVIISSDHGLIDTSGEHTIYLDEHPELAALLTLPLCGEPRCAFCYVRSDSSGEFEKYLAERLDHACELRKSRDLIGEGYFGRGKASARLAERVGEYTIVMRENYIIRDLLLNEKKFQHKGVHGGMTQEEMYVPLIVL
ncbi:MAG: alkaline phosphatase family protein [Desulfobulbaceae bacterium]|nr:alkaline phosphatase family protein [Desulfobulbaceae bacterium]